MLPDDRRCAGKTQISMAEAANCIPNHLNFPITQCRLQLAFTEAVPQFGVEGRNARTKQ
jgi:hypothetical protein